MLPRQVAFCASLIIVLPAAAEEAATPVAPLQIPPSVLQTALSEPNEPQTLASADDSSSTTPADDRALLKQKLVELDRLQVEIDQLRKASGDVQQILVRFKMVEINLTKMRQLGIDFASVDETIGSGKDVLFATKPQVTSSLRTLVGKNGQTFDFQIITGNQALMGFLDALEQNNLARVLAEPNLVVVGGQPASFHAGGEFPVPADTVANKPFHFQKFGTEVDVQPTVLGDNKVHLNFRTRISELDGSRSVTIFGTQVPGLMVRQIESGCEMSFGQTAILAGLIQERTEVLISERGRKEEVIEIQLMVLITPEEVAPLR